MNNLLYSIRSFKVGNLAFTFDYESKGFDRGVWTKVEQEPPTPPIQGATTFQITIGQSTDGSEKGYKKGEFGSIDNEYVQLGDTAYEIAQFVVSSSEISLVLSSPYSGSTITYDYALKIPVAKLSGITSIEDGGNKLIFMEGFEASIYSGNISVGDTSTLTLNPPVIKPKTFKFIAATDFTNANLFPNATYWEDQPYDFENVVVKINDVVVEQKANSITGKAGDTVEFIAENGVFPLLGGSRHRPSSSAVPDIIGEILTPMPVMTAQPISIPITDEYLDEDTSILSWLFAYKENITKIPSDFFKYYRSISSLYMTFYGVPFATDIDLYDISLSDSCPADEVKGCFRTFDHTINIHCAQDSNTYKVFSEAIKYAEDNSTDYFSVHGINLVTE